MIGNEFDVWLDGYKAAFPSTEKWLVELENSGETLAVWRGVMSDVDPDAAASVTKLMARGDIDAPAAYDRERTAAIVRKHAKRIAFESREADVDRQSRQSATRKGVCQPIGGLIRRAMALGSDLRAGRITEEENNAEMQEIIRVAGSDPNAPEPRFKCVICLDVGSVTVWHPDLVRDVKRTGQPPEKMLTAAVACSCPKGRFLASPPENKNGLPNYKPTPVYDDALHCKARYSTPKRSDVDDLMDWIFGNEDSNRHAEFDDWNAGV